MQLKERKFTLIDYRADAIMIHSKDGDSKKIIQFCKKYRRLEKRAPLVAVPITYNSITEEELKDMGINIVIYANHLIRSSYKTMESVAKKIWRTNEHWR